MSASAEKRIQQLRDEINRHNFLYYIESRPEISDRHFDLLMQQLVELEREHPELITADSPSQRVGEDVQTELKSVKHAAPMMSIENTYSQEEVRAFDQRVRKALEDEPPSYVLEPKIDGTSISLRYENCRLVLAATRGRLQGRASLPLSWLRATAAYYPMPHGADGPPDPALQAEMFELSLARMIEQGILVRDVSSYPMLSRCLRVSVGTRHENDRFLAALRASLDQATASGTAS